MADTPIRVSVLFDEALCVPRVYPTFKVSLGLSYATLKCPAKVNLHYHSRSQGPTK